VNLQLRGTIGAALRATSLDLELPDDGVPLSALLDQVAREHPRARRYLRGDAGPAVVRVIHNGRAVAAGEDPLIRPSDSVLLMHALAGGGAAE